MCRKLEKYEFQRRGSLLSQAGEALRRDVGACAGSVSDCVESRSAAKSNTQLLYSNEPAVAALHEALLNGEFATSLEICDRFRKRQGHGMAAVYLQLLLPTIRGLGRDWTDDRAGYEQIAFAFSLMHKIIETLGKTGVEQHRNTTLNLGSVIVAAAPSDMHDFGARIVAGHLSLKGWDVTFVDGFNSQEVATILKTKQVDALAISVSTDTAFLNLADMIAECRFADSSQRTEIFVGGAAIVSPHDQYSFLQADHVGINIEEVSAYLLRQATQNRYGRGILA